MADEDIPVSGSRASSESEGCLETCFAVSHSENGEGIEFEQFERLALGDTHLR